ncbi:hypothetical protein AGMMS49960_19460 [Betaproteobacteria bacterium]|nr:hypothetical protein AGMMS49960_19460 [Betaproteobacteria bacterium]
MKASRQAKLETQLAVTEKELLELLTDEEEKEGAGRGIQQGGKESVHGGL